MNILVVGLSHKTAPVEIRETIAFPPTAMAKPLQQMLALDAINEGIIVSTCNRVELYATSREPERGIAQLKHFLADYHQLPYERIDEHLYDLNGEEAIRHILRVAASLDSMVVGEPQILGQVKAAYGYASEFKTAGLILNRLMHKAFSVAKRVRTETAIASNAVSVSFAAVELARKIFDNLDDKKVMLIGAGEMCELAAKHFIKMGVAEVMVTNRTFARAEKLAAEFNGRAVAFDNFRDQLHQVDIVLSSTGAPNYILDAETLTKVIRLRRNKPMFLIDIAVPRDIEPKANKIDNLYLYDVDDLQGVVQANVKERKKEATKAEIIISDEILQFYRWISTLEVKPTIVALRQKLEEFRQFEMHKTLANLPADEKTVKSIEALTHALINKILHQPTTILKEAQNKPGGETYIDAVRTLFALPVPTADDSATADAVKK